MEDFKAINLRMPGLMHTQLRMASVNNDESMQVIAQRALERELNPPETNEAKQFSDIALAMIKSEGRGDVKDYVRDARVGRRANCFIKAAVSGQGWDGAWIGDDGQSLVDSFLKTLVPRSLVDTVAMAAELVPRNSKRGIVSSGVAVSTRDEVEPIALTKLDLSEQTLTYAGMAAIVVMDDELVKGTQGEAKSFIERELRKEVVKGSNTAFLDSLTTTSATAGSTALESLQAGLDALGDSTEVVVAADYATTRELAMQSDGRMSLTGGEFLPGVVVVPVEDQANMIVIPADRIILDPGYLSMTPSTEGAVHMSDNPDSPSGDLVSLFQNNLQALRVIRKFGVYGNAVKVS